MVRLDHLNIVLSRFTVFTTQFLFVDASAVPEGASGRCAFTFLLLWAMMLYAYYSSAIVSALMDVGQSGPGSLRMLADSNYDIVTEDFGPEGNLIFDVSLNVKKYFLFTYIYLTFNFKTFVERVKLARLGIPKEKEKDGELLSNDAKRCTISSRRPNSISC